MAGLSSSGTSSSGTSASKVDARDLIEGVQKPTTCVWLFFFWFLTTGVGGLLFPESLLAARGVVLGGSCTPAALTWVRSLSQVQVMQSLAMAGLHLAVLRNGAVETRLTSTHHMQAVRTLLLTDTVWISVACIFIWTTLIPEMKDNGWHHEWVLWESFLLAPVGIVAFLESRGDGVTVLGGLVRAQANAAHLEIPAMNGRNCGLLLWGALAFAAAPICLGFSEQLTAFAGDFLQGSCAAASSFLFQVMGLCLLNQMLSILAILSSMVIALEYSATRMLWVWSFAMAIFVLGLLQVFSLLEMTILPLYGLVAVLILVCASAKFSMGEFAKLDVLKKATGRA